MSSPRPSNSSVRRERGLRPAFDGPGLIIVLVWAVVLGQRLLMPSADGDSPVSSEGAGLVAGDEWQGLYLGSEKVGFVHMHKEPLPDAKGWRLRSEMELRLRVLGQDHQMQVELQAWLDPALAVQRFEFELEGGRAAGLRLVGEVHGDRLDLQVTSAGQTRPQVVQLSEPLTLELAARPLMAQQGLEIGRKLVVPYFDPLTQSRRELRAEVTGRETVVVMGQAVETFVLRQDLDGMRLQAWITASGEVVKEELPLGLVALRETADEARYGRHVPEGVAQPGRTAPTVQDMATRSSVPAAGRLELLRSPAVALSLEGVPAPELAAGGLSLDGGRQRLRGAVVTVVRERLAGVAPVPLASPAPSLGVPGAKRSEVGPAAEQAAALRPEPFVQSDAPPLLATARAALAGATTRHEATERLVRWVYETLDKTSVIGVPSALETLSSRRGDCNEHATLFVALARSVGLPARLLAGLVYMPAENRFFYHAWAEVHMGAGWVEVDPTFGEVPASTGHLRLVRGGLMRQVELFRLIGRLTRVDVRAPVPPPAPKAAP